MGTPVRMLPSGVSGSKRRRPPQLDPTNGRKRTRTIFLVIRTMKTETSMVEQPISAHPTQSHAMIRKNKEEVNNPFEHGVTFTVIGIPVTLEIEVTSPRKVPSPNPPSINIKGMELTLVTGDEVEEGDEEENT